MDPLVARRTHKTVEPLHALVYFAPEAKECYGKVGIERRMVGYFASRSAPFGRASAEVVIATFYNFSPDLVRSAIPAAWENASPEAVLEARLEVADRALRRCLGTAADSAEVEEAASLTRVAAEAASADLAGRPLFAAHASLPWPEPPLLQLWHAQTLLREYRGDGHIAALVAAGLDPVEALVSHAASGEAPVGGLKATRAWPEEEWEAAAGRLRERGLIDDAGSFTEDGAAQREWIEGRTDASSVRPYAALGEAGCARLRELARPLSQAVVDSGGLPR